MKSAFTRTGKRDIWGLLDDGAKSLTRWVARAGAREVQREAAHTLRARSRCTLHSPTLALLPACPHATLCAAATTSTTLRMGTSRMRSIW